MIDIEFIVQYLVLLHASRYPQLTANAGNIALLRMCSELGLIDASLAAGAADAYRAMRKLQHQVRLQGQENARVDPALVAPYCTVVSSLWTFCFA
jgi:[glutamine synthetase] adenylyltransferase / [glutamine synthetase]-adenylyl-L-tyrosine phosphorylase